jgi:hypothetical protein
MVEFDTRVFSEDDGKIIGAEVTVYSDSGDKIGLIDIADATTLAEMQDALAQIDETYFTEERLQEILTNSSENTVINATKLNGYPSSSFAKVTDLSNYAAASHTHSKSQITDLYDYQIYASSYNVNIDSSVTITVKVTNRATGNPVVGVSVPVLKNNSSWQSGTTGVNGTFTLSYTADSWGITTFSANNMNTQIKVTGWKTYRNDNSYKIFYDDKFVKFIFSLGTSTSLTTSWTEFGASVFDDSKIIPPNPVYLFVGDNVIGQIRNTSPKFRVRCLSGTFNGTLYGCITYPRS